MNKITLCSVFVVSIILFVSLSPLTILNVKAQEEDSWTTLALMSTPMLTPTSSLTSTQTPSPTPTPAPGNWSRVAIFAGPRSGEVIIKDSFTCDHSEWRIRWEVDTTHMHFDVSNYILKITTFPEGTSFDYIDFINGSLSSIYDPVRHLAGGTSYVHDNAGNFYLRILTSPYVDSYRIFIEQNTDSPIPAPTPTPTPTPTTTLTPIPTPKYPMGSPEQRSTPFEIAIIAVIAIIGIGLLVYFKKYKRN
jgi:hypothetical protein